VLLKDFKKYAISISTIIKEHALAVAQKNERPYIKPGKKFNKENFQAMRFVLLFARISKLCKTELD
jgi:hypothetical protein